MFSLPAWVVCRLTMLLGVAGCVLAGLLLGLRFWGLLLAIVLFAAWQGAGRWHGPGTTHGSARFATRADLEAAGMLGEEGLLLGRAAPGNGDPTKCAALDALVNLPWERSAEACGQFVDAFTNHASSVVGPLIRLRRYVHLLTVAPAGAGKGVSFAVPTLRTYGGGCVVFDPKAELFRLTAAARRAMGQTVIRLDPFGVAGGGADCWNLLDLIDRRSPLVIDDARAMAEALVVRQGTEPDPHWNNSSVAALTSVLALILTSFGGGQRHLSMLRDIVTDPNAFAGAGVTLREAGGLLARLGNQLRHYGAEELASVLSVTGRHTEFLDSWAVDASIRSSTFDAGSLMGGRMTIYLILPADQLQAQARLLRLWVSSLIRLISRQPVESGREVLFLLDEAGQLGYLEALEQGLTLLRGAGLRLWLFYQSAEQVKSAFKDKQNLLFDNCDTQIWFGANSWETAERVSAMIGEATVAAESYQEGSSLSRPDGLAAARHEHRQLSRSTGHSYASHGRRLVKPEEVLQMPPSEMIVFTKGVPPIRARRLLYYADPLFTRDAPSSPGLAAAWRLAFGWLLLGAAALWIALALLGELDRMR